MFGSNAIVFKHPFLRLFGSGDLTVLYGDWALVTGCTGGIGDVELQTFEINVAKVASMLWPWQKRA